MPTIDESFATALEHHQAGRLQLAEQLYRQVLAVDPNHAYAIHLLGVLAYQVGQPQLAVQYIERAVELQPADAAMHSNLGKAYQALKQSDAAIICFRRAMTLNPEFVDAFANLGGVLREQGQLEEAIGCYRRVVALKPDSADGFNNLGVVLTDHGDLDAAVTSCRRALELKPTCPEAYNNLGRALMEKGALEDAVACYRRSLELMPANGEAYNNLGIALRYQRHLDEAIACFRHAAALNPNDAKSYCNLGGALRDVGRIDEAADNCRKALALNPGLASAHYNLGNSFADALKLPQAIECFTQAIEIEPNLAKAHLNRAVTWLQIGDWDRGWPAYEWRWQERRKIPRSFPEPLWEGLSLAAKTILLHTEQGLGDTLQFIRFARVLHQQGAKVVVECPESLIPLLESCPGIDQLVARDRMLPVFDFHAPLLSVPRILKTSLQTIPAEIPYLTPPQKLIDKWRERMHDFSGLKIGINWQGNPNYPFDQFRSLTLRQFATLGEMRGVQWLSLQKGAGSDQLADAPPSFPVFDLGAELDLGSSAFLDTAAAMKSLDLVITSDTAIAHLAGALGVRVWVALRFAPEWRWQLDRSDSPWYPTMRLFRQHEPQNWNGVFAEISRALYERLSAS